MPGPVSIVVGGKLDADRVTEFAEVAARFNLSTYWKQGTTESSCTVLEIISIVGGEEPFNLCSNNSPDGQLVELEAFCRRHGLTYRRTTYGTEVAYWDPTMKTNMVFPCNAQGLPVITLEFLLTRRQDATIGRLAALMKQVGSKRIPPLQIIDPLDVLKLKRSNPLPLAI